MIEAVAIAYVVMAIGFGFICSESDCGPLQTCLYAAIWPVILLLIGVFRPMWIGVNWIRDRRKPKIEPVRFKVTPLSDAYRDY